MLADLRALDIGDNGRRGGKLDARECAEGIRRRHAEKRREAPLGGGAVEHVAGERRDRGQRAKVGRKLRVAVERIRNDDLARFDTGDLGAKSGAVAFGNAEFASGNIDPSHREAIIGG